MSSLISFKTHSRTQQLLQPEATSSMTFQNSHDSHEARGSATLATNHQVQPTQYSIGSMMIQEKGSRNEHRCIDSAQDCEITTHLDELIMSHSHQLHQILQ